MKKAFAVIIAFVLMITFSACGRKIKHDSYKNIYDRFNNISSYVADAELTVKSNLTTNTYGIRQYFLSPNYYKTEITSPESLKGTGYSFYNGKVIMHSGDGNIFSLDDYIPEDRSYIFINDFFESYYKSEDAFVETADSMTNDYTVLKNILTDDNPMRHSQKVWINNKDFTPEKLITYDMEGNEIMGVKFKSFKLNESIEKDLFK